MSTTPPSLSDATALRRKRLRLWIDTRCGGVQRNFIDSVTSHSETHISVSEVSGLLHQKAFGERRARRLEWQAGMPDGYLDDAVPSAKHVYQAREDATPWPFYRVREERLEYIKSSLGERKGAAALRDIEEMLEAAVIKWEKRIQPCTC